MDVTTIAAGKTFKIRDDGDIMVKEFGWLSDSWKYIGYLKCDRYYSNNGNCVGNNGEKLEDVLPRLL